MSPGRDIDDRRRTSTLGCRQDGPRHVSYWLAQWANVLVLEATTPEPPSNGDDDAR